MDLATGQSVSEYVRVFDSLSAGFPAGSKALVLGLGAGLTSNLLLDKKFEVQAVEFDDRVIYAAQHYFELDKKVEVFNDDARHFLNANQNKYDLVLVDVFKAEEQPSHVITLESLSKLKTQLSKKARILINWHGYSSGELGKGTSILYQTLLKQGFQVKFCSNSNDEHHRNLMLVASLEQIPKLAFEVHPVMEKTTQVNTDDKPLLEEANALANLSWRNLYLRHYTGQ
jgi:spermidine synthase